MRKNKPKRNRPELCSFDRRRRSTSADFRFVTIRSVLSESAWCRRSTRGHQIEFGARHTNLNGVPACNIRFDPNVFQKSDLKWPTSLICVTHNTEFQNNSKERSLLLTPLHELSATISISVRVAKHTIKNRDRAHKLERPPTVNGRVRSWRAHTCITI